MKDGLGCGVEEYMWRSVRREHDKTAGVFC